MSSPTAAERGTRWDWRGIAAVVRRDLRVVRGSKPVVIPMLIVPTVLLVIMPAAVVLSVRFGADAIDLDDIAGLLALLPADLAARVAADPTAGFIEVAVVYCCRPCC